MSEMSEKPSISDAIFAAARIAGLLRTAGEEPAARKSLAILEEVLGPYLDRACDEYLDAIEAGGE